MYLINSLKSEWLKTKNSAALWLCIAGGLFLPVLFMTGSIVRQTSINKYSNNPLIWQAYAQQQWEVMAILLLPMGIVLISGLLTQVEYRNNTWKQVHTVPQPYTAVFLAKLAAIVLMTILCLLLFQTGIIVSAIVPCLLLDHHLPQQPIPWAFFWQFGLKIFIACLPVIALQYLLSLRFKNFLVPVGAGFLLIIGSILLVKTWSYAWLWPYSYTILAMSEAAPDTKGISIDVLPVAYCILILLAAYYLYRYRREKG